MNHAIGLKRQCDRAWPSQVSTSNLECSIQTTMKNCVWLVPKLEFTFAIGDVWWQYKSLLLKIPAFNARIISSRHQLSADRLISKGCLFIDNLPGIAVFLHLLYCWKENCHRVIWQHVLLSHLQPCHMSLPFEGWDEGVISLSDSVCDHGSIT